MCKNRHKNFLDKMTDMWINIWWRRELDSAMCKNKHEGPWSMFMRFRFCRCMECDLRSFLLVLFFSLFPLVWWQNNWSADRGHSLKIQLWDRVKRVFVGRWRGREWDSNSDEKEIQNVMREQDSKMSKTNYKKSGTIMTDCVTVTRCKPAVCRCMVQC